MDLYDVFCAILYVLKIGCQGKIYQKIFQIGSWYTIIYFTVWKKPKENGESLIEEILKKISTKSSNCQREESKNKFCNY